MDFVPTYIAYYVVFLEASSESISNILCNAILAASVEVVVVV